MILDTPPLAISLIIGAGAVPFIITVFMVQRHRKEMNRLERVRKGMLSQYENTLLKKIEENMI